MPDLAFSLAGGGNANFDKVTTSKILLNADGTIGAPVIAWASDPDTGIYRSAADTFRTVGGGTYAMQFTSGSSAANGSLAALNSLSVSGQSNLGSGSVLFSGTITPAQITADQDNYAGFTGTTNRTSTDASHNITGMTAGVTTGHIKFIINVGSFDLVFKNDTTSTAANRFLTATGGDYTLTPNDIAVCIYDAVSARWRVGKMS